MKLFQIAAAAALTFAFSEVHAAPIDIVEGTDWSNIPNLPTPLTGRLDGDGENTISGSINFADDPIDAMTVPLLAGNTINEIRIDITNFAGIGVAFAAYDDALTQSSPAINGNSLYTLVDVGPGPFDGFFVAINSGAIAFDYEFQIDVMGDGGPGVPAPTSVALLGLGLLALARTRQRA